MAAPTTTVALAAGPTSPSGGSSSFSRLDAMYENMVSRSVGLVSGCDAFLDALEEQGFVVREVVDLRSVGVHPDNRDSYGVNPGDVHAHIDICVCVSGETHSG